MEFGHEIAGLVHDGLEVAGVVFLRIGSIVALLPVFGEIHIPARLRLVLAIVFTALVTPVVFDPISEKLDQGTKLYSFLATEAIIGLAIGFTLRLFIITLQIAGTIAAQSTSLAQIFGTAAIEPLPAIGHLMVVGGLALVAFTGLHVTISETLVLTYTAFPAGSFPDAGTLAEWGIGQIVRGFSLAFALAAPFVIASFLYNLTLGIINKAMPQLMVAFVGAPAITAGGLILLFLSMPVGLATWNNEFQAFLSSPFGG